MSVPRAGNAWSDQMLRRAGWFQARNGQKHRIYRCGCGNHQVAIPHAAHKDYFRQVLTAAIRRCEREVAAA